MDCDTARLFLHFCRPGHDDLGGPEAVELEDHLAHCTACHAQALSQRHFDAHLGRAVRHGVVRGPLVVHAASVGTGSYPDACESAA